MRSPEGGPREIPEEPLSPEPYDKEKWEEVKQGEASTEIYLKGKEMGVPQGELDEFARNVITRRLEEKNYAFVYGFRRLTGIERVLPSEGYDETEWKKLTEKPGGSALTIAKGYEMGVPQEELNRFAEEVIARKIREKDYVFAYHFRRNMRIGTEEEVRAAGERVYRFLLENGYSGRAMGIAEEVYGKDSDEWRRANEINEAERERKEKEEKAVRESRKQERFEFTGGKSNKFWEVWVEDHVLFWRFGRIGTEGVIDKKEFPSPDAAIVEKQKRIKKKIKEGYKEAEGEEGEDEMGLNVVISRDATFADLFRAIDSIESREGLGELYFELYDNFDEDVAEEVLDFRDERLSEAATTKVLDFFEEHGYSEEDVSVYLPIKFRKSRKKKN